MHVGHDDVRLVAHDGEAEDVEDVVVAQLLHDERLAEHAAHLLVVQRPELCAHTDTGHVQTVSPSLTGC